MENNYLAHVDYKNQSTQSVKEHLDNTTEFAKSICPLSNLKNIIEAECELHDVGKLRGKFQTDMLDVLRLGDDAHKGGIDHSTAGGRLVRELMGENEFSDLLSLLIYSHHGLNDCISLDNGKTLNEIRDDNDIEYELVKSRLFELYGEDYIKELLAKAKEDFDRIDMQIKKYVKDHKKGYGSRYFFMGMYFRLLLSMLIDSDWSDTESFFSGEPISERLTDTENVWKRSIDYFENYISEVVQNNKDNGEKLKIYRQEISDICKNAAYDNKNLYRLTVPTGSGKTLSSLRFALHKALNDKKQHIFYIAPFNSIIEQNSNEIRAAVGDENIVLEHHCNVVFDDDEEDKEYEYKKLTEIWNAPIISTSAVQLLNTLYSGSKSSVRRMHTLCNSVIIFDEVQAIPDKCKELFNLAVNFLTQFCNTTVVLCSATQPSLTRIKENNICDCYEMVPDFNKYYNAFKRTNIIDATNICPNGMSISDLKDFVLDKLETEGSVLVILNTVKCAIDVFNLLKNEDIPVYHISNNMCPANKMDNLDKINKALKDNQKIICVSTQVVEAGVNFSFDCVIRSKAGLDNVIQAAGRCNRHMTLGRKGNVYIVYMNNDDERLSCLEEIKSSQKALQKVLDDFKNNSDYFDSALDSQIAIKEYYRNYFYHFPEDKMKFPIKYGTIVEFLGKDNIARKQFESTHNNIKTNILFGQAFKTAGNGFEVISNDYKVPVIIPYDDKAVEYIDCLRDDKYMSISKKMSILKKLQRYTVGIPAYRRDKLNNAVECINNEILVLSSDYYSKEVGVLDEPELKMLFVN